MVWPQRGDRNVRWRFKAGPREQETSRRGSRGHALVGGVHAIQPHASTLVRTSATGAARSHRSPSWVAQSSSSHRGTERLARPQRWTHAKHPGGDEQTIGQCVATGDAKSPRDAGKAARRDHTAARASPLSEAKRLPRGQNTAGTSGGTPPSCPELSCGAEQAQRPGEACRSISSSARPSL